MNSFPIFDPNNLASVELSSSRLNMLTIGLAANQIKPGYGIRQTQTGGGTTLSVAKKRPLAAPICPFGQVYLKSVGGTVKNFMRGGMVMGGTGNIAVEDFDLGPIDPPPEDESRIWIQVTFDAVVEDDVLLPGGNVTAAVIQFGETIPDNVLPTVGDIEGLLYLDLGEWQNSSFVPSGCGNFQISHCPGSLYYARG
jgi:hypothetical protein